ncbi:MAG TPA: hypothetical protein VLH83_02415 [Chthoniobacterales bacterium]|nr:hypothetical protein [Chthoniobacterales bacterium]
MKARDVDRLLRSAANANPLECAPAEAPFGFDTRVVASWRSGKNGMNDFADLSRFLRRAGAIAFVVLVLAGAATYRQYRDDTKFASLTTNEYAIADSAIQTEFSQ